MVLPGLQMDEQQEESQEVRHLRNRDVPLPNPLGRGDEDEGRHRASSMVSEDSHRGGSTLIGTGSELGRRGEVSPALERRDVGRESVRSQSSRRSHVSDLQMQLEEMEAEVQHQRRLRQLQAEAEAARRQAETEADEAREQYELEKVRRRLRRASQGGSKNPADFLQTQLEEPPSPPPDSQFPLMKMSMRRVLVPVGKAFETNSASGFIQIQKYKCKFCDFSGNLGEVQRHETSVHGGFGELGGAGKKAPTPVKRPIPNLIPIQEQSGAKPASDRKSDQKDGPGVQPDPNESFKRKNAYFFDKLKEKLMTNSGERDLTCALCGYEAKCLSEHLKHHKSHSEEEGVSQGELSSTRCQHCRQRCKTSADLVLHLQTCSAALGDSDNFTTELKNDSMDAEENHQMEEDSVDGGRSTHPMENKVFVWNNFTQEKETKQMPFEMNFYQPRAEDREAPAAPAETSPPPQQIYTSNGAPFDSPPPYFTSKETTRKVFKCPSCSFWASTASRFHVHIVGHLNKRPFQCSLYHYNWRWDITKHIRLKQMRDAAHEKARVLLTDEAGRRNYSKYNRYIVPISIEEFRKAQVPRRGGIPKENSDPCERRVVIGKRPPEENNEEEEERPKKKPFPENKKTMWKCKKCLFRNSDRSVVLAHVKDHYRSLSEGKPFTPIDNKNQQEKEDSPPRDSLENKEEEEEVRAAREAAGDDTIQCPDFMCETCPFACNSLKTLQEHAERHFVSQSTNVRCQFCPYYAESSQALLHHLDLHLDQNPDSADDPKRNMVYPCSDCPFKGKTREQLVYLADKQGSRGKWKPGRILATFPGSDGFVRVVDVKTSNGVLRRPVTSLLPLLPGTGVATPGDATEEGGCSGV